MKTCLPVRLNLGVGKSDFAYVPASSTLSLDYHFITNRRI